MKKFNISASKIIIAILLVAPVAVFAAATTTQSHIKKDPSETATSTPSHTKKNPPPSGTHKTGGHRTQTIGTITAISNTTITIQTASSTSLTVDASKAPLKRKIKGSKKVKPSLVVGDRIRVMGEITGSTIIAQSIQNLPTISSTTPSGSRNHGPKNKTR